MPRPRRGRGVALPFAQEAADDDGEEAQLLQEQEQLQDDNKVVMDALVSQGKAFFSAMFPDTNLPNDDGADDESEDTDDSDGDDHAKETMRRKLAKNALSPASWVLARSL